MGDTEDLRLRELARPDDERTGRVVSIEGKVAVLELAGEAVIGAGALVEFRTSRNLYLGEVAYSHARSPVCEVRVQLEHKLDLAATQRIQQVWGEG